MILNDVVLDGKDRTTNLLKWLRTDYPEATQKDAVMLLHAAQLARSMDTQSESLDINGLQRQPYQGIINTLKGKMTLSDQSFKTYFDIIPLKVKPTSSDDDLRTQAASTRAQLDVLLPLIDENSEEQTNLNRNIRQLIQDQIKTAINHGASNRMQKILGDDYFTQPSELNTPFVTPNATMQLNLVVANTREKEGKTPN